MNGSSFVRQSKRKTVFSFALFPFNRTFVSCMSKEQKETINVRIISVAITIITLGIFKPLGLSALQGMMYFHLLAIFLLGVVVCFLSEIILKYVLKLPGTFDYGIRYIIRRNLWFQIINTPLEALMICLYRHFVISRNLEENALSLSNYLETFVIIAFCSFAIGIYWRFKFRSRYLLAELEETRLLNEKLQKMQNKQQSNTIVLMGTTNDTVTIDIKNLLYIEAVGNYLKVHHMHNGTERNEMLRTTSKQIENDLKDYPMVVRCHRAFLVNLSQVEQVVSKSGTMQLLIKHCEDLIPVSRSNMSHIKQAIKEVDC